MKHGPTIFLRAVVLLIGLAILTICFFLLPGITHPDNREYRPLVLGMYAAAVPFYIALFQTLKLLDLVDKNKVFSKTSIKALGYIKYCGVAISLIYLPLMPYLYSLAQGADAPGILVIGMIISFAAFVVAVFVAVIQRLMQNAIDIKSENDLTV